MRLGEPDRAISLLEDLVRPDDPHSRADLCSAYQKAAAAAINRHEIAPGMELVRKALDGREELAVARPDDPVARRDLGETLNLVGYLLVRQKRFEEALAMFERAVAELEVAYRGRPDDPATARLLAAGLQWVGSAALDLDDYEKGVEVFRREAEVRDRRAQEAPDNPGFFGEYLLAANNYAHCLNKLGRADEAEQVIGEARERMRDSTDFEGASFRSFTILQMTAWEIAAARAGAVPDGPAEAERAAAAAVTAMRVVHACRLVETWSSVERLRTEPDLLPLRDRADFRALLNRAEDLAMFWNVADGKEAPERRVDACLALIEELEAVEPTAPNPRVVRRSLAEVRHPARPCVPGPRPARGGPDRVRRGAGDPSPAGRGGTGQRAAAGRAPRRPGHRGGPARRGRRPGRSGAGLG